MNTISIFSKSISSHLLLFLLEATFLVKCNIVILAIKNDLVAIVCPGQLGQNMDDFEAEFFAPLRFVNDDIFDVTTKAAISQELFF